MKGCASRSSRRTRRRRRGSRAWPNTERLKAAVALFELDGVDPAPVIDPTAELGEGAAIAPFVVIGRGVRIGPRAAAQQRLAGSVWAQCRSWYRMGNGKVIAIFPGFTREYVRAVREPDFNDYRFDGAPEASTAPARPPA